MAAFYKGEDRPEDTAEEIEKLKADYQLGEQPVVRDKISIEDAMQAIVDESTEVQ